ncbi:hypothetical protein H4R35_007053, partial [Dimargaris xerosporica]
MTDSDHEPAQKRSRIGDDAEAQPADEFAQSLAREVAPAGLDPAQNQGEALKLTHE